jgi:ribose/xylose/arabinose/galactoside ABC-type transport system permease subunit
MTHLSSSRFKVPSLRKSADSEYLATILILLVVWIFLVVISVINRSDFLSRATLSAVTFNMCIIGILAIGQGFVVISGGILDLSITVSMLITSFMIVVFYDLGWNTPLLIIVSLLCAGVFGLFNSILVVWLRINPLIVTLATGFAGGGLLLIVFDRGLVDPKSSIADFGTSYLFGLPTAWWPMALLTIGAHFFFKYSRVGRHFLAVGGNPLSSKAMGISLKRTRVATFVGSSIFGGIAGIVFAGFTPEIRPNAGEYYTLPVIAAVVLAGFSLAGGRGSFLALFISVGFLSTIPTALVFFGLESIWQTFIQGFILIIAVSIDAYRIVKVRGR